jgi:hypothetical protein
VAQCVQIPRCSDCFVFHHLLYRRALAIEMFFFHFSVAKKNWLACFQFVFLPLFSRRVNTIKKLPALLSTVCHPVCICCYLASKFLVTFFKHHPAQTQPCPCIRYNTAFYFKTMLFSLVHIASGSSERLSFNKSSKLMSCKSVSHKLKKSASLPPFPNEFAVFGA